MTGAFGAAGCRGAANAVCAADPQHAQLGCASVFMLVGCAGDPEPLSSLYGPGAREPISPGEPVLGTSGNATLARNWTVFWDSAAPLQTTLADGVAGLTSNYVWSGLTASATAAPAGVTCNDWSSTSFTFQGEVGDTTLQKGWWWESAAVALCGAQRQAMCACVRAHPPSPAPTPAPVLTCTRYIVGT